MAAVGTTHHVKLGTEFLILRPNTYTKRPAPTFGARIATGDPSYNNLSIWQHWVQTCWIGGMGATEWTDDAMYDIGAGIDVTTHEKAALSRDLMRGDTGTSNNWNAGGNTNSGEIRFMVWRSVLYGAWLGDSTVTSRLYKYNAATDHWDAVTLPANFVISSMAAFDGRMVLGGSVLGATPKIIAATAPGTWLTYDLPAGVTQPVTAMKVFNARLYVAFQTEIWRMKDTTYPTTVAKTWDGSTVFYSVKTNSGSNAIVSMEVYLGQLFMLSGNAHLHRTDGNNSFDVWDWDGNTMGTSLRSYDGKLFVATYEYGVDSTIGVGVLYQWTGAAVTELKRWGNPLKTTRLGQMIVWNRLLFYGAGNLFDIENGFGVVAYDSVEDSHSIWAENCDTATYTDTWASRHVGVGSGIGGDWLVSDIMVFGNKMFVGATGHGFFFTYVAPQKFADSWARFTKRGTNPSPAAIGNGGFIQSSMYDAGTPGLKKLWGKVTVFIDLPHAETSFRLYYSLETGPSATWVPAAAAQYGPGTANGQYVYHLNNVISTRIRYKIVLNTSNNQYTPVLRGIIFAYLPQPEPNWMWTFTIPVSDKWDLMDDTVEVKGQSGVKTTNQLIAYLEGLFRTQQLVDFIDVDGVSWADDGPGVLVYDLQTVQYSQEAPSREGDVRITLLEAVETY